MKADFQEKKKNDWRYINTPDGDVWWNYSTHEVEPRFWYGLIKKIFNL